APLVDPAAIAREIGTVRVHAGNSREARAEVVQILKRWLAEARRTAEQRLIADADGRSCAEALSQFQDDAIRVVYDWIVTRLYP
ncbi:hypothetical protein, partial [Enterobacter hormaechei]|uniref:hypothetical protein n=1 Tax=Enterobacter hormaechei TaxID=158836 RepID=UPI0013D84DC6